MAVALFLLYSPLLLTREGGKIQNATLSGGCFYTSLLGFDTNYISASYLERREGNAYISLGI